MRKRPLPRHGGPARSHLTSSDWKIRRLIQNGGLAVPGSSAGDVAQALRIHHPEYRRLKLEVFTSAVRRVLSAIPSPSPTGSDNESPSRRRRRHGADAASTSSSASTSVSDEAAGQPPAFDVTKAMLRSQYASQTPKKSPGASQQLEIEVAAEKARRLITSDGGACGDAKPDAAASEGVVRGDKGPRFADLGGLEAVIEQLMMEVVVPLCHPELPQCLGVRPVAGLLLHGPPGCGKTTLAHAIANETGVPFYKISAPEVVSGVSGIYSYCLHHIFSSEFIYFDKHFFTAHTANDQNEGNGYVQSLLDQ
jgi:ribosome biogenesis ATPase